MGVIGIWKNGVQIYNPKDGFYWNSVTTAIKQGFTQNGYNRNAFYWKGVSFDNCKGHVGTNGVYHYYGTTNYSYVVGDMKGKVILDPSTPAPENQILPYAFASLILTATAPLSGAQITVYTSTGINA